MFDISRYLLVLLVFGNPFGGHRKLKHILSIVMRTLGNSAFGFLHA
jgi:hypothetical protein